MDLDRMIACGSLNAKETEGNKTSRPTGELVVSILCALVVQRGGGLLLHRWWGAIWKKDLEVERSDLPPLRGGGRRGKLFIVRSVKLWEIS